jgi:hypothetical protein
VAKDFLTAEYAEDEGGGEKVEGRKSLLGAMVTRRGVGAINKRKRFTPGEHAWVMWRFGMLTRPEDLLVKPHFLAAV